MHANTTEAHAWLRQLEGEWTMEGPAQPGDGQQADWSETVRTLGDVWIIAEGRGTMPDGTPGTTMMTLGFDTDAKQFVGTWVGSMMTQLWHYVGTLDEASNTLTLETEGADMERPERTTQYRDIIELVDPSTRIFRSEMLEPDGSWKEIMRAQYGRVARAHPSR